MYRLKIMFSISVIKFISTTVEAIKINPKIIKFSNNMY